MSVGGLLAQLLHVGAILGGLSALGGCVFLVVFLLVVAVASLVPVWRLVVTDPETAAGSADSGDDTRQLLNSL